MIFTDFAMNGRKVGYRVVSQLTNLSNNKKKHKRFFLVTPLHVRKGKSGILFSSLLWGLLSNSFLTFFWLSTRGLKLSNIFKFFLDIVATTKFLEDNF